MPLIPMKLFRLLYADELTAVLQPGEQLLTRGFFHGTFNGDESKLELENHELSDAEQKYLQRHGRRYPRTDKFIEAVDIFGLHANPDRIKRLLSGVAGSGPPGSLAGRMWRTFRDGIHAVWWVTDRRFILLEGTLERTVAFEVGREQIARVSQRFIPLFQWARVRISFTDGSMIAFNAAILDVGAAWKLRKALSR